MNMAAALLTVLHFVLIHGACHGSWAWYRLEDQLQKAGHTVTSLDLSGAGINPTDPDTITSWEEYHKPALDFFQSLPERAANEKVRYLDPHASLFSDIHHRKTRVLFQIEGYILCCGRFQ